MGEKRILRAQLASLERRYGLLVDGYNAQQTRTQRLLDKKDAEIAAVRAEQYDSVPAITQLEADCARAQEENTRLRLRLSRTENAPAAINDTKAKQYDYLVELAASHKDSDDPEVCRWWTAFHEALQRPVPLEWLDGSQSADRLTESFRAVTED
jgi:septal ring factor EnvC (AmiA/AmiB activator)